MARSGCLTSDWGFGFLSFVSVFHSLIRCAAFFFPCAIRSSAFTASRSFCPRPNQHCISFILCAKMKFLSILVLAASVSAAPHHQGRKRPTTTAVAATAAATTAADAAAIGGTVTRGDQTLVFTEVNGVPGNECLTFRNNGRRSPYSTYNRRV